MLRRLGTFAVHHPYRVIGAWAIAIAVLIGSVAIVGTAFIANITAPASESSRGFETLQSEFDAAGGESGTIVFRAEQGVTDPEVQAAMTGMFDEAVGLDHVVGLISPYEPQGAAQISSMGDDAGKIAYAQLALEADTTVDEGVALRNEVQALQPTIDGLQVELGGALFREFEPPNSELLGIAFAIFVLIIAFGSVIAMGLPIGTALAGVATGVILGFLASHLVTMPDFAATIAVMIGLGVGIDYALFIVTRYRDGLADGLSVEVAVVTAMDTAGRAVLIAGVTVVVSLLGMLLMGVPFVAGLGIAASITVATTMAASVTLLPALLGIVGERINVTRIGGLAAAALAALGLIGIALDIAPLTVALGLSLVVLVVSRFWGPLKKERPRKEVKPLEDTIAYRWSHWVQRRAKIITVGASVLLIVLAIPVLSLRLGFSDAGNDPEGSTTREAYDLLAEGFGPGVNGPLLLVTELNAETDRAAIEAVSSTIAATPGVAFVSPGIPNDFTAPTALLWQVIPTTSPQDAATGELVHTLRVDVLPPLEEEVGAEIDVTGLVAANIDFSDYLAGRLWLFYGAVLSISYIFLMIVFRSILVPLKAVIMNLLAIGAAYGVVVAIFQWGWLSDITGVVPGPVEAFLPMMLFAIVFGLSMDYEVFLLTRMREEYDRTGDNSSSVADGLAMTARVITAAAAIMVFIFGSFVLEPTRVIQIMGLGLAVAVAIDATLVRMLLVPATMELLGDKNWWIPTWLDKILPNLVVEPPQTALDPSTDR
jgi:RND superfamily putative drug exporter